MGMPGCVIIAPLKFQTTGCSIRSVCRSQVNRACGSASKQVAPRSERRRSDALAADQGRRSSARLGLRAAACRLAPILPFSLGPIFLDGAGAGSTTLPILAAAAGQSITAQGLFVDPTLPPFALTLSNGLRLDVP